LTQNSKILSGDETSIVRIPEIFSIGDLAYFKYAPINYVDVEHSFSMFEVLLADIEKVFNFKILKNILLFNVTSKVKICVNLKYLKQKYFVNCCLVVQEVES